MRSCLPALLFALALASPLPVAAAEPQVAAVTGLPAPKLALAGCAARRVLLINLYDLRLYLPQRASATAAFDPNLPRALELSVTYPGNVPGRMPEHWRQRLDRRLPPALIADLDRMYQNLRGGDVVLLEYRPDRGTRLRLNGTVQMADHGPALMDTLVELWMGPQAVYPDVRHQLLSGRC